ncbi:YciI family protein [uncultured Dokdonia sp.]|uniref:YciI family protein n=1 Tax=uncultured Dokdonia sp. TaxID=575653 RepID=UPI00261E6018|nr:YciI family protein [uncultured Dokdonia sp.]
MKAIITYVSLILLCISCAQTENQKEIQTEKSSADKKNSVASQIAKLKADGYQIFDYVDEKTGDTVIMQQYFMAFLKSGPNRNQSEEEATKLQEAHQAHLGRMYELGYADISGPFGDDGELRGITVYNVPTLKMADSLANLDPMMKSGRLIVEIKPWWAGKGYPLR